MKNEEFTMPNIVFEAIYGIFLISLWFIALWYAALGLGSILPKYEETVLIMAAYGLKMLIYFGDIIFTAYAFSAELILNLKKVTYYYKKQSRSFE